MKTENEAYLFLFDNHLDAIILRLRAIPSDKLDWIPGPGAPSARMVGEHAWVWLVCDRQHLTEPDVTKHARIEASPATGEELCSALEVEQKAWCELIEAITPEQFDELRYQFGRNPLTVRLLVSHITQQIIYKSGQLSTLYFALGLDGDEPYTAEHPNEFYGAVSELDAHPIHAAVLKDDISALRTTLSANTRGVNEIVADLTPLILAVCHNSPEAVTLLLQHGADPNVMNRRNQMQNLAESAQPLCLKVRSCSG